jgi:hypothetical protein
VPLNAFAIVLAGFISGDWIACHFRAFFVQAYIINISSMPEVDNVHYTPNLEYFLQRKGEECEAWSNLHLMCHKKFKKTETYFNLPIITITAFIGFVSGLNLSYEYIHLILGGMSLYASLLKSYFSYLKISQKNENHRIAYIQYGQIANEIRVELALEPTMRNRGSGLLDLIRIKMKNLLEVSEIVDNAIIHEYLSKIGPATRHDVLQLFTRERTASHNDGNEGALGQPHVLRLANRVESYVDIENKVMRLPNAGRSMSSQVDTKAPASASVSDSGSESSAESDAVSGIMV